MRSRLLYLIPICQGLPRSQTGEGSMLTWTSEAAQVPVLLAHSPPQNHGRELSSSRPTKKQSWSHVHMAIGPTTFEATPGKLPRDFSSETFAEKPSLTLAHEVRSTLLLNSSVISGRKFSRWSHKACFIPLTTCSRVPLKLRDLALRRIGRVLCPSNISCWPYSVLSSR